MKLTWGVAIPVVASVLLSCSHSAPPAKSEAQQPAVTPPAAPEPAPAPAPEPVAKPITILYQGMGSWHHKVTTTSEDAQRFFDQGLSMMYGFNHPEAIRSFQEAARLDPDCAMAYWGIAIALGPNYNLPTDPESEKTAREMVAKAQALEPKVTPAERDYIEAAAARYAGPIAADRSANDQGYANAMREVAKKYPDDVDASVLFAESMMDLRPWKLWKPDGSPADGTQEILSTLEGVLAKHPEHPGANHFYIHAQESGPHPEKAVPEAKRLPSLIPAIGHIQHMPCHIFVHVGMWKEASDANENGIAADKAYLAQPHAEGIYAAMYVGHNFQFLNWTAAMEGRGARSLQAARTMTNMFPADALRAMSQQMPGVDYLMGPVLFTMVRFGMWDDILKEPAPPDDFHNLAAIRHFARAMALARTGKLKEARAEQAELQSYFASLTDKDMVGPLNSAKALFSVATSLLAGELEAAAGHRKKAIALEKKAVAAEDALNYDEPPPWQLPTREYLAALMLEAKKPRDAIKLYQEDLKRYPENGWSLFGLEKAYTMRKDKRHAKEMHERFTKAWTRPDVQLETSRF